MPTNESGETPGFLTVGQVAEQLNTGERFVRRLIEERRIPFHRFGTHVRVACEDVEAFVQASRVEARGLARSAS